MCVALAGGAFALGRASVDTDGAERDGRAAGEAQGPAAGEAQARAAGLREGRAQGVVEGRALQVPTSGRRAFRAGYVAGANDAFGGFDGGWTFKVPYVITLGHGKGGVTYRIDSRRPAGE